jgi:hypothetical protein
MNPAKEHFDRTDFLHAWLDGFEYRHAHPDLQRFYGRATDAYCRAFQIDMTDMVPGVESTPGDSLADLFRSVVEARSECRSPFSYYIQAPREIDKLHHRHGESIDQTIATLREQYDKLLLHLLEMMKCLMATTTIPRELLMKSGFPTEPAPEPIEYL